MSEFLSIPTSEDPNTLKVLVVVDVQNCFMYNDKDGTSGATFLNLESGASGTTGMEQSKAIIQEIAGLAEKNELIVFTRDYHPINHISFEGDEGRVIDYRSVWPHHCRNITSKCASRLTTGGEEVPKNPLPDVKNTTKIRDVALINEAISDLEYKLKDLTDKDGDKIVGDLPVYGTELSYMYYGNEKLRDVVFTLNQQNKLGKYKIGLQETIDEYPNKEDPTELTSELLNNWRTPLIDNGKEYISLTKGERCNQESYSAFNYHINYDITNPSKPEGKGMPVSESNTTGLWEYIIDKSKQKNKKNIEVTVCGLVGNVCVMYSVTEGIAMWNDVYAAKNPSINIKMIYSLMGTRFTAGVAPNKVKPFETINTLKVETGDTDAFLKLMNEVAPTGSNGKYEIYVEKSDIGHHNKIPGFSFIGYNGVLDTSFYYKMEVPSSTEPTTTMGGNVKHKHTYKYRKCTVCGCKSRKARKDCTRKHNKRNKMGGKRSRKH